MLKPYSVEALSLIMEWWACARGPTLRAAKRLRSVVRIGIDDDFDATVLGLALRRGIGGPRMVAAQRENRELLRLELTGSHQMLEYSAGLRRRHGMGSRCIGLRRVIRMSLNYNPLPGIRTGN